MGVKRQRRIFFEEDDDAERKQDGFGEIDGRQGRRPSSSSRRGTS